MSARMSEHTAPAEEGGTIDLMESLKAKLRSTCACGAEVRFDVVERFNVDADGMKHECPAPAERGDVGPTNAERESMERNARLTAPLTKQEREALMTFIGSEHCDQCRLGSEVVCSNCAAKLRYESTIRSLESGLLPAAPDAGARDDGALPWHPQWTEEVRSVRALINQCEDKIAADASDAPKLWGALCRIVAILQDRMPEAEHAKLCVSQSEPARAALASPAPSGDAPTRELQARLVCDAALDRLIQVEDCRRTIAEVEKYRTQYSDPDERIAHFRRQADTKQREADALTALAASLRSPQPASPAPEAPSDSDRIGALADYLSVNKKLRLSVTDWEEGPEVVANGRVSAGPGFVTDDALRATLDTFLADEIRDQRDTAPVPEQTAETPTLDQLEAFAAAFFERDPAELFTFADWRDGSLKRRITDGLRAALAAIPADRVAEGER